MSFNNNDEDGDGLAALFGGITPQAIPKPADEARPAVAPTPAPQQPAAAGYGAPVPTAAPTAAPGYPSAASYDLPAPTEAPRASASPSAAPQYPGLSPAPTAAPQSPATAYPATAYPATGSPATAYPAEPSAAPQYPAQAPNAFPATQYPPAQAPATATPTTQYPAAQYPPAENPAPHYPGLETPAGYPGLAPQPTPSMPPSYDLPAPAGQPPFAQPPVTQQPVEQTPTQYPAPSAPSGAPAPLTEPPGYPGYEPPVPGYSTAPPAEYAQPSPYDLPAPAAAPSLPPVSAYEPASSYEPAPSYEPVPSHPAPAHDPMTGYDATARYDAVAGPQPTPGYEPPSSAPSAAAGYGGSESQVGAELLPKPVTPAGPLLPSTTAAVVTPEDLERSTVGEKIGLALAVVAGPIGLLVAIINAVRGGQRRGWLIGISRISLVLGVLSTIATVIVAIVYWNIRVDQMQHDDLAAASAEFCAAGEENPAIVTPPTVGFPTQGNSIPETIDAMTAWTTRWTDLAATSPAKLRTGLELLAAKGQEIVDSVTESRSVDDALNAQVIASVEAQSGVAAWYTEYCVAP